MVVVLGGLVVVNLYVFVLDKHTGVAAIREQAEAAHPAPAMTLPVMPLAPAPAAVTPATAATVPPVPVQPASAIEGKVGKSDTLGKLLKKNGLTAAETDELIRSLSGVLDFRTIRAGQAFHIERGGDGRVMHFDLELAKGHHVRADRQASGELLAATH